MCLFLPTFTYGASFLLCFLSEFLFDLMYVERVPREVYSSVKNSCSQMTER